LAKPEAVCIKSDKDYGEVPPYSFYSHIKNLKRDDI
jgi:hypothetical protein